MEDRWICCQIGAREHYSFPRALSALGLLEALVTDAWVAPDSVLGRIRLLSLQRLRERYHTDLSSANVRHFTRTLGAFEFRIRLCTADAWSQMLARNRWFQQQGVAELARLARQLDLVGKRVTLFAYSYAARELFRFAKQHGWRTILGQIDGGSQDAEIIAAEHRCHPKLNSNWSPAPSEYWRAWKEECSLADHIIVNSDWSKQLLVEAGIDARKQSVVPVAYEASTEAQAFQRSYPAEFSTPRPLRLLFLGAFTLRKGAPAVLEAIRLLKDEPVEFWIVGALGIEVPKELQDSPKVKWIGSVSRDSTAAYYRDADIFLFPTVSDGFGMTQVEARGWKLPIIATPFCAPIVQHGVNGLIIAESSGILLAETMRRLLPDPDKIGRLAEARTGEYGAYSLARVREHILALAD